MQITFFGLTLSSSWGNGHATPYRALLKALKHAGHRVIFFEKDVPYYARRRDFDRCDYCELVLYAEWEQVRAGALRTAAASDAVICASYVPDGARIADEVLGLHQPLHVFYDLDTPVTLDRLHNGGCDYLRREQIPEFDLYLSFTGGATLRELEQTWGARSARPLYGCVDRDEYRRVEPHPAFRCALSYMGTYSRDRQHKLEDLFLEPARRLTEARFVLAGSLYPDQPWPENIHRFEHVAPAEHAALYSSSRTVLNITRDGMARHGYCPSGRLFEAAACGAPIVSDWWQGLDSFFAPGEEIFVVRTAEDVMAALRASDADLAVLAQRARRRTLEENSGEQRAHQLIEHLEEAALGLGPPVPASVERNHRPLAELA